MLVALEDRSTIYFGDSESPVKVSVDKINDAYSETWSVVAHPPGGFEITLARALGEQTHLRNLSTAVAVWLYELYETPIFAEARYHRRMLRYM